MLIPEGESGSNQKKSLFHMFVMNVELGLKAILSLWNRWINMSLALIDFSSPKMFGKILWEMMLLLCKEV